MREADWSLHPATERTMAFERRTAAIRRRLGWGATACFVVGCPFSCLMGGLSPLWGKRLDPTVLTVWFTSAALLLGVAHRVWRNLDESLVRAHEGSLADDYAALDGWIVDLRVLQGATVSGQDRGVVWIENGRLFFAGERTSFGLSPDQAHAPYVDEGVRSALDPRLRLPLTAQTSVGGVTVGIDLVRTTGTAWRNRPLRTLVEALRDWQAAATWDGEGQLPPLSVGPGTPLSACLLRSSLLTSAVWVLFALALALLVSQGGWLPALGLIALYTLILAVWVDLWMPRRYWRAWRDRRRLESRP